MAVLEMLDVGSSALMAQYPVTSVLVALAMLLSYVYYQALPKPLPGIPYTKKSRWRLFGDAFDFVQYSKETGEGFRWFAAKAAELQSPVFQLFFGPFAKPAIVVADIQELIDMASRRGREFDRGGFINKWLGILFPESTISMPSHDKFRLQRSMWAPTMTSQFLNTVSARTIHQHTQSLVKLWEVKSQRAYGRPFDVSDDIKHAALDMLADPNFQIWTAATGDDLGLATRLIEAAVANPSSPEDANKHDETFDFRQPDGMPEIVHAFDVLVEHLKSIRASPSLALTKFRIKHFSPSWNKAWQCKEDTISRLIDTSRERYAISMSGTTREARCAMDEVFKREAAAEAKGKRIGHREMIDETLTYIFGGHETMQDTTRWGLKFLTANPSAQARLRAALLEIFPGAHAHNLPPYATIVATEHPYVEASIQELIRISLTTPSMTRRTTCDTTILGHRIPAGTDVFGAPSVESLEDMDPFPIDDTTRSPSSKSRTLGQWDRATKGEYRPERWIDSNGQYQPYAGPMLPFGAGTRGCFGQKLARLELRMIVTMLVLSFDLQPVPEEYASFRAEEVINRGPKVAFLRPVVRT